MERRKIVKPWEPTYLPIDPDHKNEWLLVDQEGTLLRIKGEGFVRFDTREEAAEECGRLNGERKEES